MATMNAQPAAPKKRGRPLGSKNAKRAATSSNNVNVAEAEPKRRAARVVAQSADVAVPTIAQLTETDILDDGAASMDIDPGWTVLSAEARAAQSAKILQDATHSLYGLESLRPIEKHTGKLEREIIVASCSHVVGVDDWPNRTHFACFHCRQPIQGVPMRHCRSVNWSEDVKKYILDGVYGWWHNPQCLRAYLEQTNVPNIGHEFMIVSRIIQLVLGMTMEETEGIAPPWQALRDNGAGGYMTFEEFMQASKASDRMRVTMIDNNILIPSVVLFEITKRSATNIGSGLPILTNIGMEIDPETGALHDTSLTSSRQSTLLDLNVERDKVWPKFRVSGYGFRAVYSSNL